MVKVINLANSFIIALSQMTLLSLLTFQLGFLTLNFTNLLFYGYFYLLSLQLLSLHFEIVIILQSQFPLTFLQIQSGVPLFISECLYYFRVDLDGFPDHRRDMSPEDTYKLGTSAAAFEFCDQIQVKIISRYINLRSNLTHFHISQLLVQLSQVI